MVKLANGIIFKRKGEKQPDFVKGKVSIRVDEFIKTLQENQDNGWVNLDMLLGKDKIVDGKPVKGNIYFAVNDWKPNQEKPQHPFGQGKTFNDVKPMNVPVNNQQGFEGGLINRGKGIEEEQNFEIQDYPSSP